MLGPIFMGGSHTWRLPYMYWNQQTADYYAGHCSHLKNFANSWPSASNFKGFSRSLEHFFLTIGQNNFQWLVSDDSWFQKLDHGVWKCLELMWIVSIQAFLNNNIQKKGLNVKFCLSKQPFSEIDYSCFFLQLNLALITV